MKAHFFLTLILLPFLVEAQQATDSLQIRILELNNLCAHADTLHHTWDENDIVDSVLSEIGEHLILILQSPDISKLNIQDMENDYLNITTSSDKKIIVFQWDENTGGSFRSCESIFAFYDDAGKLKLQPDAETESLKYISGGDLWVNRITKLIADKNIYLMEQSGITCNTCYVEYVETVELTDSGLIAYDGFYGEDDYAYNNEDFKRSSYGIEYRWNESNSLVFDPERKLIISSYFEDDLSGYYYDPDSARYFSDTLVFDGEMFLNSTQRYFLQLNELIKKYDSVVYINENINSDSIEWLNFDIEDVLTNLVTSYYFDENKLEDLKSIGPWEIINSDDKRLIMVSWESDPPSHSQFADYINLFFYRDENNLYHEFAGDEMFPAAYTAYDAFYQLKADPALYILTGTDQGCIYCSNTNFAQVIQVENDSMNLNYPAFENKSEIYNDPGYEAITYGFDFDEDSDELYYHILIDDTKERHRENVKIYKFENGKFQDISPDPLRNQIDELKKIMDQASSLRATKKNAGPIDSLNIKIYNGLYYLLSQPEIINYNLEEIIQNDFFRVTRSDDEMLNIYSWKTNKKNEQLMYINLIQSLIYPYLHAYHMISHVSGDSIDMNAFNSTDSQNFYSSVLYDTIFKLSGDGYYNQYLVIGHEYPFRNCERKFAKVFTTDDLEIYEAAAFENRNEISIQVHPANILKFEYDPELHILSYSYKEDEVSGYSIDKRHPQVISVSWKYDGNQFVLIEK